ncbi:MAG: PEPxxWA-CTERM sorting domain-containing protein [Caulobacteraceae bacterium]
MRIIASIVAVACAAPLAATADTDVSINTAPYAFASYGTTGNPIATTPTPAGGASVSNDDGGAYDVGFWTATTSFSLSSTNATLSITDLAADDRVVVELNGAVVDAAGIYGPGTGTFIFTPTGSQVAQTFNGNSNGIPVDVTSGFVVGLNTIELIVNNTGSGIYGGLTGGPTSLTFAGLVTPNGGGVPEPATWAMMLVGVGGLGAMTRLRRRQAALTA